jgi:hypothetical protein
MVKTEYANFYLGGLLEVFPIASKRRKTKTTFRNLAAVELHFFMQPNILVKKKEILSTHVRQSHITFTE